MQAQELLVILEAMAAAINVHVQTVKGNSFSNTQKTDTVTAGTAAIDDGTTVMITELQDFLDSGEYTAPGAYDDTAAAMTNVYIKKPLNGSTDKDGIAIELSNKVEELREVVTKSEEGAITNGQTNEVFTRTSDYNTAVTDLLAAFDDMQTALYV